MNDWNFELSRMNNYFVGCLKKINDENYSNAKYRSVKINLTVSKYQEINQSINIIYWIHRGMGHYRDVKSNFSIINRDITEKRSKQANDWTEKWVECAPENEVKTVEKRVSRFSGNAVCLM